MYWAVRAAGQARRQSCNATADSAECKDVVAISRSTAEFAGSASCRLLPPDLSRREDGTYFRQQHRQVATRASAALWPKRIEQNCALDGV